MILVKLKLLVKVAEINQNKNFPFPYSPSVLWAWPNFHEFFIQLSLIRSSLGHFKWKRKRNQKICGFNNIFKYIYFEWN